MINLYKVSNTKFLCYGDKIEFPDNFELIEKNVDPTSEEYRNIDIISYTDFITYSFFKKRTTDIRLEEEGIRSFHDLSMAYVLLKTHELHKSKKIRDLVLEKYTTILDELDNVKDARTKETSITE